MAASLKSTKEYVRANRTFFLFVVLLFVSVGGYFWWRSGFTFEIGKFFAWELNCDDGDCDGDGRLNPSFRGDDCDDSNPNIGGKPSCRWCQLPDSRLQVGGTLNCDGGDCDGDGYKNPGVVGGDDCDDANWCTGGSPACKAPPPPPVYTCTSPQFCQQGPCPGSTVGGDGTCASGQCCKPAPPPPVYTCTSPQFCQQGPCPGGTVGGSGTCASGQCCKPAPPPPANSPLNSSPTTITSAGTSTLQWNYPQATSCTAANDAGSGQWTGSVPNTGTRAITGIGSTTTFSISCSTPTGAINDQTTVTVSKNTCRGNIAKLGAGVVIGTTTATASVRNDSSVSCVISLASYQIWSDRGGAAPFYLDTQTFFKENSATLAPGATGTLTVGLPTCFTQVDLAIGAAPQPNPTYNSYDFLGVEFGNSNQYCNISTPTTPPTTPPTPTALSCAGTIAQADIGQTVPFSATGGTGTYTWYAPSGNPFTAAGNPFNVTYAAAGNKTVTVVSGGNQATCTVQIISPMVTTPPPTTPPPTTPPPTCTPTVCPAPPEGCQYNNRTQCSCELVCPSNLPLVCQPTNQTVNIGQSANFQASGGPSQTFSWSAPGGNPTSRSGTNQSFLTTYSSPGGYLVTVTSGNQSAICNVTVRSSTSTSPALAIEKTVRVYPNGTEQESVTANPAQTVEFAIRVSSTGSGTATQVIVRDTLPAGLTYQAGTTTVDSSPAADGIIGSGLALGNMAPGRTITVRFRALLAPVQFFATGTSSLVNTAYARAQNTPEVSDIAIVNVVRETTSPSISLVKLGRNVTRAETGERSTVYADPGQTVEFIIRTRNTSAVTLTNVRLRDVVPSGITFIAGTVKLNAQPANDAFVTAGLPIGSLTPNQEAVVTFSGRVANAAALPAGISTLINTAYVTAENVPQLSAQLPVIVAKPSVPVTQVPTGPGESTILALIISAVITLLYVGYTGTDLYQRREVQGLAGHANDEKDLFNFRR